MKDNTDNQLIVDFIKDIYFYHCVPGEPKKIPPPYDFCWYYSNAWEFLYEILHDC